MKHLLFYTILVFIGFVGSIEPTFACGKEKTKVSCTASSKDGTAKKCCSDKGCDSNKCKDDKGKCNGTSCPCGSSITNHYFLSSDQNNSLLFSSYNNKGKKAKNCFGQPNNLISADFSSAWLPPKIVCF